MTIGRVELDELRVNSNVAQHRCEGLLLLEREQQVLVHADNERPLDFQSRRRARHVRRIVMVHDCIPAGRGAMRAEVKQVHRPRDVPVRPRVELLQELLREVLEPVLDLERRA